MSRLADSESITVSDDGESVSLHRRLWMPYQTTDATGVMKSGLLGVSKHLDTVINNIRSVAEPVEPRIERIFWSNRLDPSKLDEFRRAMHEFLESVSDEAAERIEPFDGNFDLENTISGGVGFYYFDSEIS